MRIAIDTRWIRSSIPDGIGRVAIEIIKEIVKMETRDYHFLFIYNSQAIKEVIERETGAPKSINWIKVDYPVLSLRDFFSLPDFLRKQKIDIYYTFNYLTSWLHKGYKVIITVHDLIPYIFKNEVASLRWKLFYSQKFLTRKFFLKADRIIVVSEATKSDLIKMFKIPEKKIKVIMNGVTLFGVPNLEKIPKAVYGKKYILYVGRIEQYKNIQSLIISYLKLSDKLRQEYSLVIVGKGNDNFLRTLLENKGRDLKNKIIFLKNVSDEELIPLYKNASLFVYPSLYEGFGLPPLEAMNVKVPVIASNIPSLREVLKEAAIFVDPKNVDNICQSISRVLEDDNLQNNLIEKGTKRVKEFSWDKSAKELIRTLGGVYKEGK